MSSSCSNKATPLIVADGAATSFLIYKYASLDSNTISNLVNETIYFNNVNNFDDPTDAAFIILTGGEAVDRNNLSQENVQKLYNFMNVKYAIEAPEQEPQLTLIRVCDQLEKALKKYIGVSCFSKHKICTKCGFPQINPLMLTYYANRHSGIVIEYECKKPKELKEIKYSLEYTHFNYASILNNLIPKNYPKCLEINDDIIIPLLFKFKEWAYQDEYRLFSIPNNSLTYSELGLQVKRIFLGSRVKKQISNMIIKILANKNICFYYLRQPISHKDQQRVIICDGEYGATRKNCCIKCELTNEK